MAHWALEDDSVLVLKMKIYSLRSETLAIRYVLSSGGKEHIKGLVVRLLQRP